MTKTTNKNLARSLLLLTLLLFASFQTKALAHEGHDHTEEKEAVTANANNITRTMRAGAYEITLKHSPLEPDKETAIRVFIVRYDTNEAIDKAKILLLAQQPEAGPIEVQATASSTAGMYEAKLPPFRQGDVKLFVRAEISGGKVKAEFENARVEFPEMQTPTSISLWARTLLIAIGVLIFVAALGALTIFIIKASRKTKNEEETATAL